MTAQYDAHLLGRPTSDCSCAPCAPVSVHKMTPLILILLATLEKVISEGSILVWRFHSLLANVVHAAF